MSDYLLMARLLDYPDGELSAHLDELTCYVREQSTLATEERHALLPLLDWMQSQSTVDLQAAYVQTFDMQAEHSLHLTHHLFGDDRGRGPALIDLGEHYKANGLEPDAHELPDYLPLILEYVSTLDDFQARVFLADALKVITVLAANLEQAQSPYAALLRIIERRGQLAPKAA